MAYLYLAGAIFAEVIATMSLRASEGFSKSGFVAILIIGYVTAFLLLNASLVRGMPLGVAYGIWSAVGVAAVALLSIPVFGEGFTTFQSVGLILIILGVAAMEMGATDG